MNHMEWCACGSNERYVRKVETHSGIAYSIRCKCCGYETESFSNLEDAKQVWNEIQEKYMGGPGNEERTGSANH